MENKRNILKNMNILACPRILELRIRTLWHWDMYPYLTPILESMEHRWQVPWDVKASFPFWLCRLLLHTPVQMPLQVFRRGLLVLCGDCQYQKQIGRFKSSLLLYIKSRCHRNHHYSCHHGSNWKFHFMYCMILFYGAVHFFFV